MPNKRFTKVGCAILTGLMVLSFGCTAAQKKPLPKQNVGRKAVYPNVYIAPRSGAFGTPTVPGMPPRYVAPIPPMKAPGMMTMEQTLANDARKIKGVNDASVLVIGRTAFVGLDINKDMKGNKAKKIKKECANKLKANSKLTSVMVTADPDLLQRIQDILAGRATPNVIGDLYTRMKMEK